MPPKKKKISISKTTIKTLEKTAGRLWKEACYVKWGDNCTCCGAQATVFHHFVPKSISNNLRYDVLNGVPVCQRCHYLIHFTHDTLKRRYLEDAIIKKRGKKWITYISKEKGTRINKNKMWFEEQIERLKCLT